MKYHVHYVEDVTPKIISFKLKKDMNLFIKNYIEDDGNFIEFAFKGEFLFKDKCYEQM